MLLKSRPHRVLVNPGVTLAGRCSAKILSVALIREGKNQESGRAGRDSSRPHHCWAAVGATQLGHASRGPLVRGPHPSESRGRPRVDFRRSSRSLHYRGNRPEKYAREENAGWSDSFLGLTSCTVYVSFHIERNNL